MLFVPAAILMALGAYVVFYPFWWAKVIGALVIFLGILIILPAKVDKPT